jgi:hypothetical protein
MLSRKALTMTSPATRAGPSLGALRAGLAAALLAVSASAALSQSLQGMPENGTQEQGTPEQREACTPDAFNLCHDYIPDAERVKQCLIQHVNDLSAPCREVFEHGEKPRNRLK